MDYFNIQVAAQVSGVSAHTIRAWEKRYQALVPKRSDNGRRQYTEDDINRLSLLSRLTNLGSSIGQIAHLEDEKLRKLLGKLAKGDEALMDTGSPLTSKADPESILRNILMGLALFKLDIISHELDKAQKELTPADLALKVIIPLFQEVGNKVQSGELNIAQEHSLSAITKFSIGQVIHRHYLKKSKISTKIVLATPEKEFHAIGILAAALLCCQHNYDLMYFGRDLPAQALAQASNAVNADIILLGVSPTYESLSHMSITEYTENLQNNINEKTQIWLGGANTSQKFRFLTNGQIKFISTLEELDNILKNNSSL